MKSRDLIEMLVNHSGMQAMILVSFAFYKHPCVSEIFRDTKHNEGLEESVTMVHEGSQLFVFKV